MEYRNDYKELLNKLMNEVKKWAYGKLMGYHALFFRVLFCEICGTLWHVHENIKEDGGNVVG